MNTKIGVITLAHGGNLGDDLITIAVIQSIQEEIHDAEITVLDHGAPFNWTPVLTTIGLTEAPQVVARPRDLPLSRECQTLFENMDAIVFGGGGLIQTSHHPERPYHWLRYLPDSQSRVIAVGLGLGPISDNWVRRLAKMGSPFDGLYLRDKESIQLANTALHWKASQCRDFIDREFLEPFMDSDKQRSMGVLGVALRAWDDLDDAEVIDHIISIAKQSNIKLARFFVLESRNGMGPDVEHSQRIMRKVQSAELTSTIHIYDGNDLPKFVASMMNVSCAISMKLHSSAIWEAAGVPIYPIIYAPKIAAFFNLPYKGTKIIKNITSPEIGEMSVMRSSCALKNELKSIKKPSRRIRLTSKERLKGQIRSFYVDAPRKVISVLQNLVR